MTSDINKNNAMAPVRRIEGNEECFSSDNIWGSIYVKDDFLSRGMTDYLDLKMKNGEWIYEN